MKYNFYREFSNEGYVMIMTVMMMMMKCFYGMVGRLAVFPAETIVRDPHHRESPTCRGQDLHRRRALVQALLNEDTQY